MKDVKRGSSRALEASVYENIPPFIVLMFPEAVSPFFLSFLPEMTIL